MPSGDPNIPITNHGGCLARSNCQFVSQLTTYWLEFESFIIGRIIFSIESVVYYVMCLKTHFLANLWDYKRNVSSQYIQASLSDY